MSYALRTAARQAVDALRDRARIARREGAEHLATFLELQASRLDAPLLVEEAAEQRRDAEASAARLHRGAP